MPFLRSDTKETAQSTSTETSDTAETLDINSLTPDQQEFLDASVRNPFGNLILNEYHKTGDKKLAELGLTMGKMIIDQEKKQSDSVLQAINDFKQESIDAELQNWEAFSTVVPPDQSTYSSEPKLCTLSTTQLKDAFPDKNFSGSRRGPNIREFLNACNRAQTILQLAEDEFVNEVKFCCEGDAYDFLDQWDTKTTTAQDLYYLLLTQYDDSLPPYVASERLETYRIPEEFRITQIESEIGYLAKIASYQYTDPKTQSSYYNETAVNTLIRVLPPNAKRTVLDVWNLLCRMQKRQPTYSEMGRAIRKYHKIINEELNPGKIETFKRVPNRRFMDFTDYSKKSIVFS